MTWIDTSYEKAMESYFIEKLGDVKGKALFGEYTSIRNALVDDNFFKEIKGAEPSLSDHSESHIQDVLERAYKVIGDKHFTKFNVYEIYSLALMILLHDVGNIFGRDGHEAIEKIAEVYNKYRVNKDNYREEKRVILVGASAHSGTSSKGSKDTLKEVNDTSLKSEKIRLQELAAILRFSDELAEGKQRTCSFLIDKGLYNEKSQVFHEYAQITSITIDRSLERVAITYHIDIPKKFDKEAIEKFKNLIQFTYYRATKLDLERRYTKNYSDIIKRFKYVTVQYNFSIDDIPIELELNSVSFEDKYPIPGEAFASGSQKPEDFFVSQDSNYQIEELIKNLTAKTKE